MYDCNILLEVMLPEPEPPLEPEPEPPLEPEPEPEPEPLPEPLPELDVDLIYGSKLLYTLEPPPAFS